MTVGRTPRRARATRGRRALIVEIDADLKLKTERRAGKGVDATTGFNDKTGFNVLRKRVGVAEKVIGRRFVELRFINESCAKFFSSVEKFGDDFIFPAR